MNKKFNIEYRSNSLVIERLTDDYELEDLYEALGDIDIIECNEISYDGESILVDSSRGVFRLTNMSIRELHISTTVSLVKESSLLNYVNLSNPDTRSFLAWYYSTTTGHGDENKEQEQAIKTMFEEEGWVCTDPDQMQFRYEVHEGEEYEFVQRDVYPDGLQVWHRECYTYSDEDYSDIMNACLSFRYSAEQIDKWMSEGEEIPLMLECLFELNI